MKGGKKDDAKNLSKLGAPGGNKRTFPCKLCSYKSRTKRLLVAHLAIHNLFQCGECPLVCKTFFKLQTHMQTHTGIKTHSCELCSFKTVHSSSLKRHRLKVHGKEKKPERGEREESGQKTDLSARRTEESGIEENGDVSTKKQTSLEENESSCKEDDGNCQLLNCQKCGARFTNLSGLQGHDCRRTAEKAYDCSVCGKRFNQKSKLDRHSPIHTGEKPYECHKCGNRYSRSDTLKLHIRKCGRTPKQKRQLSGCLSTRRKKCSKQTKSPAMRKKRTAAHIAEGRFSCGDCGENFGSKNELTCHLCSHNLNETQIKSVELVHTSENDNSCESSISQTVGIAGNRPNSHSSNNTLEADNVARKQASKSASLASRDTGQSVDHASSQTSQPDDLASSQPDKLSNSQTSNKPEDLASGEINKHDGLANSQPIEHVDFATSETSEPDISIDQTNEPDNLARSKTNEMEDRAVGETRESHNRPVGRTSKPDEFESSHANGQMGDSDDDLASSKTNEMVNLASGRSGEPDNLTTAGLSQRKWMATLKNFMVAHISKAIISCDQCGINFESNSRLSVHVCTRALNKTPAEGSKPTPSCSKSHELAKDLRTDMCESAYSCWTSGGQTVSLSSSKMCEVDNSGDGQTLKQVNLVSSETGQSVDFGQPDDAASRQTTTEVNLESNKPSEPDDFARNQISEHADFTNCRAIDNLQSSATNGTEDSEIVAAGEPEDLARNRMGELDTTISGQMNESDNLANGEIGEPANFEKNTTDETGKLAICEIIELDDFESTQTSESDDQANSETSDLYNLALGQTSEPNDVESGETSEPSDVENSQNSEPGHFESYRTSEIDNVLIIQTGELDDFASSLTIECDNLSTIQTSEPNELLASSKSSEIGNLASTETGEVDNFASSQTSETDKPAICEIIELDDCESPPQTNERDIQGSGETSDLALVQTSQPDDVESRQTSEPRALACSQIGKHNESASGQSCQQADLASSETSAQSVLASSPKISSALQQDRTNTNVKKLYQCDQCEASFSLTVYLYTHRVSKHGNNGWFECQICKELFRKEKRLQHHARRFHSGENAEDLRLQNAEKPVEMQPSPEQHATADGEKRKLEDRMKAALLKYGLRRCYVMMSLNNVLFSIVSPNVNGKVCGPKVAGLNGMAMRTPVSQGASSDLAKETAEVSQIGAVAAVEKAIIPEIGKTSAPSGQELSDSSHRHGPCSPEDNSLRLPGRTNFLTAKSESRKDKTGGRKIDDHHSGKKQCKGRGPKVAAAGDSTTRMLSPQNAPSVVEEEVAPVRVDVDTMLSPPNGAPNAPDEQRSRDGYDRNDPCAPTEEVAPRVLTADNVLLPPNKEMSAPSGQRSRDRRCHRADACATAYEVAPNGPTVDNVLFIPTKKVITPNEQRSQDRSNRKDCCMPADYTSRLHGKTDISTTKSARRKSKTDCKKNDDHHNSKKECNGRVPKVAAISNSKTRMLLPKNAAPVLADEVALVRAYVDHCSSAPNEQRSRDRYNRNNPSAPSEDVAPKGPTVDNMLLTPSKNVSTPNEQSSQDRSKRNDPCAPADYSSRLPGKSNISTTKSARRNNKTDGQKNDDHHSSKKQCKGRGTAVSDSTTRMLLTKNAVFVVAEELVPIRVDVETMLSPPNGRTPNEQKSRDSYNRKNDPCTPTEVASKGPTADVLLPPNKKMRSPVGQLSRDRRCHRDDHLAPAEEVAPKGPTKNNVLYTPTKTVNTPDERSQDRTYRNDPCASTDNSSQLPGKSDISTTKSASRKNKTDGQKKNDHHSSSKKQCKGRGTAVGDSRTKMLLPKNVAFLSLPKGKTSTPNEQKSRDRYNRKSDPCTPTERVARKGPTADVLLPPNKKMRSPSGQQSQGRRCHRDDTCAPAEEVAPKGPTVDNMLLTPIKTVSTPDEQPSQKRTYRNDPRTLANYSLQLLEKTDISTTKSASIKNKTGGQKIDDYHSSKKQCKGRGTAVRDSTTRMLLTKNAASFVAKELALIRADVDTMLRPPNGRTSTPSEQKSRDRNDPCAPTEEVASKAPTTDNVPPSPNKEMSAPSEQRSQDRRCHNTDNSCAPAEEVASKGPTVDVPFPPTKTVITPNEQGSQDSICGNDPRAPADYSSRLSGKTDISTTKSASNKTDGRKNDDQHSSKKARAPEVAEVGDSTTRMLIPENAASFLEEVLAQIKARAEKVLLPPTTTACDPSEQQPRHRDDRNYHCCPAEEVAPKGASADTLLPPAKKAKAAPSEERSLDRSQRNEPCKPATQVVPIVAPVAVLLPPDNKTSAPPRQLPQKRCGENDSRTPTKKTSAASGQRPQDGSSRSTTCTPAEVVTPRSVGEDKAPLPPTTKSRAPCYSSRLPGRTEVSTTESVSGGKNKTCGGQKNGDQRSMFLCYCGTRHASKQGLHSHQHVCHGSSKKPCQRTECGDKSAQKRDPQRRPAPTNGDEKPLSCDLCGKQFPQKKDLAFHVFSHFGAQKVPVP